MLIGLRNEVSRVPVPATTQKLIIVTGNYRQGKI